MTIGSCHGGFTCRKRHILTKFDRSRSEIPITGYAKFEVIAVRSPVHLTVRLLAHRQPHIKNWTKLQSTNEFASFNIEMQKYFEDEENQVMHLPIALGDMCACVVQLVGETLYQRGQIVKIEEGKYVAVTRLTHSILSSTRNTLIDLTLVVDTWERRVAAGWTFYWLTPMNVCPA